MCEELTNRLAKSAKKDVWDNSYDFDDPYELLSDIETKDVFIGSLGNLLTFIREGHDIEEAESIFISEWLYRFNEQYGEAEEDDLSKMQ